MKKRYQSKTSLDGSGGINVPQTKGWSLWCNTDPKKLARISAANLKNLVGRIKLVPSAK
jgi:hypothetical protein